MARIAIVRLEPLDNEPAITAIEVVIGDEQFVLSDDVTQQRPASDHVCKLAQELITAILQEVR